MPTGIPRVLAFLHPIVALATLVFIVWVASLGLRSRERTERHLRPQHARLAVVAYWLMVANLGLGVLSTWLWRADIELLRSMHFRLGLAIVALLSVAALTSRWIANDSARILHPILGLLAVVLAALQVFFGMPLLPL
ncbi:MAG: DUF4079 family protein [Candidatus Binatia bacterium]